MGGVVWPTAFEERDRVLDRLGAAGGGGKLKAAKLEVDEGVEIYGPPEPMLTVDGRAGSGGGGFFVNGLRCGKAGGCFALPTPFPATFPTSMPPFVG